MGLNNTLVGSVEIVSSDRMRLIRLVLRGCPGLRCVQLPVLPKMTITIRKHKSENDDGRHAVPNSQRILHANDTYVLSSMRMSKSPKRGEGRGQVEMTRLGRNSTTKDNEHGTN